MAPGTAVYYSSNFVILKFYRKVYFSHTEACQGLHLFPLCAVMNSRLRVTGPKGDRSEHLRKLNLMGVRRIRV